MTALYPVERNHPTFPLWALGKMLILFALLPRSQRTITFYRLQTLLTTVGVIEHGSLEGKQ